MEYKQKVGLWGWKKRLDHPTTVLNLLLALSGWNRWGGSASCLPATCPPMRMHNHTHTREHEFTLLPFLFISLYSWFCLHPSPSLSPSLSFNPFPFIISPIKLYLSRYFFFISVLPFYLLFLPSRPSSLPSPDIYSLSNSASLYSPPCVPPCGNACIHTHFIFCAMFLLDFSMLIYI